MKTKSIIRLMLLTFIGFGLNSCLTIPKGAVAVQSFNKERYLGKWYEIARIDFAFEKNLDNTTATYSNKKNGDIKADNRGYNTKTGKWKQATGKAKFVRDENTAMLKVSFFGPFYGGYTVLAIDDNYKYALVGGGGYDNLWILSRGTTIPEKIKNNYLNIAKKAGYKTEDLLWINHDKVE